MWRIFVLAIVLSVAPSFAHAALDCGSVKASHEQRLLEVNGAVFQMKSEKLGKGNWRLTGHDMVFVHTGRTDSLIRNGGTLHLKCTGSDTTGDEMQAKTAAPYAPNALSASATTYGADADESAGTHHTAESKSGRHGSGHGGGGHGGGKGK